jgi:hypothetical protein
MARRSTLSELLGDDPMLPCAEHIYLGLLAAQAGRFAFTGSATVVSREDVGAIDDRTWQEAVAPRLARRLANASFPVENHYDDLARTTNVSNPTKRTVATDSNPHILFYADGDFAQIEFCLPGVSAIGTTPLKLQVNDGNYSVEIGLTGEMHEACIEAAYIEMDPSPVFRIYFNGDETDFRARYAMLPKGLQQELDALRTLSVEVWPLNENDRLRAQAILATGQLRMNEAMSLLPGGPDNS